MQQRVAMETVLRCAASRTRTHDSGGSGVAVAVAAVVASSHTAVDTVVVVAVASAKNTAAAQPVGSMVVGVLTAGDRGGIDTTAEEQEERRVVAPPGRSFPPRRPRRPRQRSPGGAGAAGAAGAAGGGGAVVELRETHTGGEAVADNAAMDRVGSMADTTERCPDTEEYRTAVASTDDNGVGEM